MADKYISINTDGKKHLKDLSDINISVFNNDVGYANGAGDMSKKIYDTNNDGVVDRASISDVSYYSSLIGRPNSSPTNIDDSVSKRHSHENKTTIDKITDTDGQLLYNGIAIQTGGGITKTSQLINDSNFVNTLQLATKIDKLTNIAEDNILTMNATGGLRDSGKELSDFAPSSSIVTKTSQLTNDSNFIVDSNYTHTDNNYTTTEKTNLSNQSGINTGDETNTTIKTKLGISSTTTDGYLASIDYNKFNNKIDSIKVSKDSTLIGNRSNINLTEGSGITLTMTDNSVTNAVDIKITSSNGGGTVKSVNGVVNDINGEVTLTKSNIGLSNVDNVQQIPLSYLDTTITLGTSNTKVPSQNSVKTYIDNGLSNKSLVTTSTTNGNIKIDNLEKTVYTLPIATETVLGGVKAGNNITIGADGTISSVVAGGDMLKSTYDANSDGVVNDSDKLGGQLPSYYAKESDLDLKTSINDSNTTSLTETYSINKILSLISSKQNKIYIQNIQPTSPSIDDVWINNTSTPYIMNVYNGTIFVQVGGESNGKTITSWTSGNAYSVDDLAIYNENIYKCAIGNSDTSWIIGNWSLISSGETQIQSNWTEIDTSSLAYIKNKPTLPIGTIVGTTDVQTLTNKDITSNTNKFGIISPKTDSVSSIKTTKSDGTTAITTVDSTNNIFKINNCLGLPVLTTTQRNALIGLSGGETVFDSTLNITMCYDGSFWFQV